MEEAFIVFVDMLGFGDLIERDERCRRAAVRFSNQQMAWTYRTDAPSRCVRSSSIDLRTSIDALTVLERESRQRGPGQLSCFPILRFLQMNSLKVATDVARELMRNLIFRDVPARIGVGHGSFTVLRFMSDASTQVAFHVSQFLGLGVVRAHAAEQCGAKGMRILLTSGTGALCGERGHTPCDLSRADSRHPSCNKGIELPVRAWAPATHVLRRQGPRCVLVEVSFDE